MILMNQAMLSLITIIFVLCARSEGISLTPPRGWNSYNSFSWTISEKEFLDNAQIVADKLLPYGYEYVVIDFLWFRKLAPGASVQSPGFDSVDEWGRPIPDPDRWPSSAGGKGLAPVAYKIHKMGLKLGLHVMRGINTAAVFKNTPILGANGWKAQDIALKSQPCPWMQQCFLSVNSSTTGGKAFLKSLYDQYASWGVDFVKHDCVFGADNLRLDEITAVSQAIVDTGRPIVYSLSPGVQASPTLGELVYRLVHMYRITGDDWDRWGDLAAHFDVARNFAAAGMIGAPGLQGGKSWPDLDMLPLGWLTDPGAAYGPYRSCSFTLDEKRTQMTLWAMAKSPLMFGGDLRHLDSQTFDLLTDSTVLEINSYSSGNVEKYAGSAIGSDKKLPVLALSQCTENSKRWMYRNEKVCWEDAQSFNNWDGCISWTPASLPKSALASVVQSGNISIDSQANLISKVGMYTSKLPTVQTRKSWQLTPDGALVSDQNGKCAVVEASAPIRIWVARGPGGRYYVAFFNLGQNSTTISFSLKQLLLSPTSAIESIVSDENSVLSCSGQETWSKSKILNVNSLSADVPAHGCALFSLACHSGRISK